MKGGKRKGKKFGSRGFTVDSNPGAVAAILEANARLAARVLARRKAKGQKPDTNGYIPLGEEGG
jgi:hypothetical protein